MRYVILALILVSSTAFADATAQANDAQKGTNGQASGIAAPDNSNRNVNSAPGNVVPNGGQKASVPAEFLSAPQYQPQPLSPPSLLYSLNPT